jgi:YD repeat-containing protein
MEFPRMKKSYFVAFAGLCFAGAAAQAAETITYSYDARGRLVKVVRTGTVNNNVQVVYTHDKANNRKTVVVTGSGNVPPP